MLADNLNRSGNFIDTANIYTACHSEKIVVDYFAKENVLRDHAVISTKFFCNLFPGDPNGWRAGRLECPLWVQVV